jgi:hypothetical protein
MFGTSRELPGTWGWTVRPTLAASPRFDRQFADEATGPSQPTWEHRVLPRAPHTGDLGNAPALRTLQFGYEAPSRAADIGAVTCGDLSCQQPGGFLTSLQHEAVD